MSKLAQAFYDMHIIEHYGSGVRRMRNECDKNGSPYPAWTSEKGEFCIRFPARTRESAARLGIDVSKFGLGDSRSDLKLPDGEQKLKDLDHDLDLGLDDLEKKIIELILKDELTTYSKLANNCACSVPTVQRRLAVLQKRGLIRRVGPDRGGRWEVC